MFGWQESLLSALGTETPVAEIFERVAKASRALGFTYCAFGLRKPVPFTGMQVVMMNDYPTEWQRRYAEAGYLRIDPTVAHGRHSREPIVWQTSVFESAETLWREAQDCGLRVGWAQSSADLGGSVSMLTLARSSDVLSASELASKEALMRWLVSVTHMLLAHRLDPRLKQAGEFGITPREIEMLKWTADGKTSGEIADILSLSIDTVNFHIKKVVAKLSVANKTAAVALAIVLGILD